ncbi:SGNH/GDSL hydrolase family protein [Clostridium thermarum]|uniref:SGNH/GDSL hydrolase family protein n=1 Tax=Clostridium thermarum TaxID=1716543 RepID=UPI00111EAB68|nr:SGNH/GDSL hydrolase family protein [Clostridium thermarum]
MLIQENSKLVMIGDSITDAGRNYNVGEGWQDSFGYGYVNLVNGMILSTYPEKKIRIVNKGISGNTIRDLKARWKEDVLDLKPDWLSIMIGINDVWRHYNTPLILENRVGEDEFRENYEEIVSSIRPQLKGLVIMSPYIIEPNKSDVMRAHIDRYGQIAKEVADKNGAIFVDTQKGFDDFCKVYYSAALSLDRIHPNTTGHMIIAKAFLSAVEFNWNK